jgi:AGZA family xanthine/uracil permease-like MFS transporter
MAGSFLAAQMIPLPATPQGQVAPLVPAGPANTMQDLLTMEHPDAGIRTQVNGFLIHGLNIMERGYIFTCMILAAMAALLIDGKLKQAATWSAVAAGMTWLGLIHAYQLKGNELDYLFILAAPAEGAFAFRAGWIGVAYLLMAAVFVLVEQSGGKFKPTSGQ